MAPQPVAVGANRLSAIGHIRHAQDNKDAKVNPNMDLSGDRRDSKEEKPTPPENHRKANFDRDYSSGKRRIREVIAAMKAKRTNNFQTLERICKENAQKLKTLKKDIMAEEVKKYKQAKDEYRAAAVKFEPAKKRYAERVHFGNQAYEEQSKRLKTSEDSYRAEITQLDSTVDSRHFDKIAVLPAPSGATCTICLSPITGTDGAFLPLCGHHFHITCIIPWLDQSSQCPNCKCETSSDWEAKWFQEKAKFQMDEMKEAMEKLKAENNRLRAASRPTSPSSNSSNSPTSQLANFHLAD